MSLGQVERARHQVAGTPGISGQQGVHVVEYGGIEVVVGPFKRVVRLEALALGVAVEPVGLGGGIEEVDIHGEDFSKRAEERQVGARHQGGRKDEDAPIGLTDAGKAEPGLHFPEGCQIGGVGLAIDQMPPKFGLPGGGGICSAVDSLLPRRHHCGAERLVLVEKRGEASGQLEALARIGPAAGVDVPAERGEDAVEAVGLQEGIDPPANAFDGKRMLFGVGPGGAVFRVVHAVEPVGNEQVQERKIAVGQHAGSGSLGSGPLIQEPLLEPCLLDAIGHDDALAPGENVRRRSRLFAFETPEQIVRQRFKPVSPLDVHRHAPNPPVSFLRRVATAWQVVLSDTRSIRLRRIQRGRGARLMPCPARTRRRK